MADTLEEDTQSFDLDRYMGIARRRHLHFLIALFLGWIIVWGASWLLPPRYKSGTLILVERPTLPKDYITPNVSEDLQDRLQSITQQILSRTRLLHIISQLNLYGGEHADPAPDEKVERMRKDIQIELVRGTQNQVTAFNVYYSARDAHVAQQVTSELTNLFISENLEARQQQSQDTTKFLEQQLELARQNLAAQEEKVREFKGQHVGELPTQVASNLQILGGLQSQLQTEEDALNAAKQQHVYLETLLNQYRSLSPKVVEANQPGVMAIDQELDKLKSDLADLSARYTERHPDVRKLKEQIAKTETMREQLLAEAKSTQSQPGVTNGTSVRNTTDLAQASPIAQLQSQMEANQIEINNREQTIGALKAKVNDYQARLNQEPVREQELADLTRGYDQSRANYDELLKKKNDSAMATSMELLQQGERFRVIDPPSLPLKPEFPNHLKFCGIGLAVGLVLGLGVVAAFERLDDRLYSEKELKELLPVPVISEIPVIVNPSDQQIAKRKVWLARATAAMVFGAILVASVFSYFRG
jgi:polysaccharide biosynthesis transport protein